MRWQWVNERDKQTTIKNTKDTKEKLGALGAHVTFTLYYYPAFPCRAKKISRCQFCRAGLACSQQGIDHITPMGAELVAVRLGDLVDQAMGTQ